MKKILSILVLGLILCFSVLSLTSCSLNGTLVVYTESGFAPFEYVKNGKICGVDVDIMELVGKKLGKKVVFEDVAFDTIIDSVSQGKLTNIGAAGLSITEDRKAKVDFSQEYYQANLYVIYNINASLETKIMSDGNKGVYWSSLKTDKGIGIQTGTTADLFLSDEIAKGGLLEGVKKTSFTSLDTAISDISLNIDYVIIDELPAKALVSNNKYLACLPLYYEGEEDELAFDTYAICVTKGQTELLEAINAVLDELLVVDEKTGINQIQALVNKHLGL